MDVVDCDVVIVKKKKLKPCERNNSNNRYEVTENYHCTIGYMICWVRIPMYYGILSTSKSSKKFWSKYHREYMYLGYNM